MNLPWIILKASEGSIESALPTVSFPCNVKRLQVEWLQRGSL